MNAVKYTSSIPGNSSRDSNFLFRTTINLSANFFLPSLPEISSSVKSLIVERISERNASWWESTTPLPVRHTV